MRALSRLLLAGALLAMCAARGRAQTPGDSTRSSVGVPRDATARCVDGTFSSSRVKQGTCSGHRGIGAWYGLPSKLRTARCNDGYYSTSTGSGTCSQHKGVWYWSKKPAPKP